jgi:Spy/CpxP family protein refolding chaperone
MRFWLALTGALIFAAGAAVGFSASRGLHPASTTSEALPMPEASLDAPFLQSQDVYKDIGLTDDQRQRLDGLLAAHYREVSRIRSSMAEVFNDLDKGVDSLLSPEQREGLQQIRKKYTERDIQLRVRHEILGYSDLNLSPEQADKVYPVLFDAELARREAWRSCRAKEKQGEGVSRDQVRGLMGEISARRDARLQEVFSPEQWELYRERKDRERKFRNEQNERRKDKSDKPEKDRPKPPE